MERGGRRVFDDRGRTGHVHVSRGPRLHRCGCVAPTVALLTCSWMESLYGCRHVLARSGPAFPCARLHCEGADQRQPYARDRGDRTEEQERCTAIESRSVRPGDGGCIPQCPQRFSRDCRIPIQTSPTPPAGPGWGHQHIMEWLVRYSLDHAGRASHIGVQWNVDPLDRLWRSGRRNRSRVLGWQLRGS